MVQATIIVYITSYHSCRMRISVSFRETQDIFQCSNNQDNRSQPSSIQDSSNLRRSSRSKNPSTASSELSKSLSSRSCRISCRVQVICANISQFFIIAGFPLLASVFTSKFIRYLYQDILRNDPADLPYIHISSEFKGSFKSIRKMQEQF